MKKFGRRIIVVGSCGSGKSTLCRQIGKITGLKVIHLDRLYWKPGWIPLADEDFKNLHKKILEKENWIIDGNYAGSLSIRLEKADTVIFLDVNRYLCVYRVLKRWLQYRGKSRPDMTAGCFEKMDWEFLKFTWDFPNHTRKNVYDEIRKSSHLTKIILRNNRERKRFLDSLKQMYTA